MTRRADADDDSFEADWGNVEPMEELPSAKRSNGAVAAAADDSMVTPSVVASDAATPPTVSDAGSSAATAKRRARFAPDLKERGSTSSLTGSSFRSTPPHPRPSSTANMRGSQSLMALSQLRSRAAAQEHSARRAPYFGSLSNAHGRLVQTGLTMSRTHEIIFKFFFGGPLLKEGFRHRRLRQPRLILITGRLLTCYAKKRHVREGRIRAQQELTAGTEIFVPEREFDEFGNEVFGFEVRPGAEKAKKEEQKRILSGFFVRDDVDDGDEKAAAKVALADKERQASMQELYYEESWSTALGNWFRGTGPKNGRNEVWKLFARDAQERDRWVRKLREIVSLVKRAEMPATLSGSGDMRDHYDLGRTIGNGRYGKIRICRAKVTKETFAVKVVYKSFWRTVPEAFQALTMEIAILKRVTSDHDHPHICKLYQVYETDHRVYFVVDHLAGGSVKDMVRSKGVATERDVARFVRQICSALQELHENGIVVCDINPDNVLYWDRYHNEIKLHEFGRALIMPNSPAELVRKRHVNRRRQPAYSIETAYVNVGRRRQGVPGYLPPEAVSHHQYSPAADVWAVGCVVYYMLSGKQAFGSLDDEGSALTATLSGVQSTMFAGPAWQGRSPGLLQLLGSMLTTDKSVRIRAKEVLEDSEWLNAPPEHDNDEIVIAKRRQKARDRFFVRAWIVVLLVNRDRELPPLVEDFFATTASAKNAASTSPSSSSLGQRRSWARDLQEAAGNETDEERVSWKHVMHVPDAIAEVSRREGSLTNLADYAAASAALASGRGTSSPPSLYPAMPLLSRYQSRDDKSAHQRSSFSRFHRHTDEFNASTTVASNDDRGARSSMTTGAFAGIFTSHEGGEGGSHGRAKIRDAGPFMSLLEGELRGAARDEDSLSFSGEDERVEDDDDDDNEDLGTRVFNRSGDLLDSLVVEQAVEDADRRFALTAEDAERVWDADRRAVAT